MTTAQEQFVNNIITSHRFGGCPCTVTDLSNGFILLAVTLKEGVIRWAVDKDGRHDPFYFGKKGYETWHRLFYGTDAGDEPRKRFALSTAQKIALDEVEAAVRKLREAGAYLIVDSDNRDIYTVGLTADEQNRFESWYDESPIDDTDQYEDVTQEIDSSVRNTHIDVIWTDSDTVFGLRK